MRTKALVTDRFSAAYLIILLQGAATCIPWKGFMTETDFLNFRARQGPSSQLFAHNFESFNVLACMTGNVVGFLLYIPLHHILSLDAQVLWPQLLTLGILIATMVITQVGDISGNVFMAIILIFQFVIGLTNATITGGVYNMAGWLPPSYIQGMSLGMGLSGMGVAGVSLLTLMCFGNAELPASSESVGTVALYYFGGAAVMIVIAILTYFVFFQLPFVHSHSIPEVVQEWTVTCPVNEVETQPKSLIKESASFLRLKIRNSSTNSLTEALSKSLSMDERAMFLSRSYSDTENQLLEPFDEGLDSLVSEREEEDEVLLDRRRDSMIDDPSPSGRSSLEGGEVTVAITPKSRRNSLHIDQPRPLVPSILGGEPLAEALFHAGEGGRKCIADTSHPSASTSQKFLEGDEEVLQEQDPSMGEVVRRMWAYNLVMAGSCVLTMAVFPGVTSYICSVRNSAVLAPCHPSTPDGRFFGDLFVPFMFLVCNAGDVFGRIVAGVGYWANNAPTMTALIVYSLLRIPLAGVILFSNVVTAESWRLPRLIRSDVGALALAFSLCATGGNIQSLVFTHAPSCLPKTAHDRLGPLINFAVAAGTTLGCVISLLFTYSLQVA